MSGDKLTIKQLKEMDRLVAGVRPTAKLPKGFEFWSWKLQLAWLRQHQLKPRSMPNVVLQQHKEDR